MRMGRSECIWLEAVCIDYVVDVARSYSLPLSALPATANSILSDQGGYVTLMNVFASSGISLYLSTIEWRRLLSRNIPHGELAHH